MSDSPVIDTSNVSQTDEELPSPLTAAQEVVDAITDPAVQEAAQAILTALTGDVPT